MDKQIYKDRILETENLTDELDDSSASWLLDWGVSQLDRILDGAGEAAAGERVNALMAVMRKINRVVGKLSSGDYSKSRLAEDLLALHDLFAAAFPPGPAAHDSEAPGPLAAASASEPSAPSNAAPPQEETETPPDQAPSPEEERPSFMTILGSLFGKKPSPSEPPAEPESPPEQAEPGPDTGTPPAQAEPGAVVNPGTPSEEARPGAAAEPHTPPAQAEYVSEASHLLEMETRPALEYLARDFYRS